MTVIDPAARATGDARHVLVRRLRRFFAGVLFVSISLGCLGAVLVIFNDGFDDREELAAAATLGPALGTLYACLGLLVIYVIKKGRFLVASIAVLLMLTMAVAVWLVLILGGRDVWHDWGEELARLGGTLTVPAVVIALTLRFLLLSKGSVRRRLAIWAVVTNLGALGAWSVMLMWTTWWHDDVVVATVAVALIVWIACTLFSLLVLPAVIRMRDRRKKVARESLPGRITVALTCPRCQAEQALPAGGLVACGQCRFALVIEIDEPRCECGYLLYRLAGDACPECGAIIPEAQRWSAW